MVAIAQPTSDVFAGNRATGSIALSVVNADGVSRRARVQESGSLRARFSNGDARTALEAVIINTAGGMAGGDRFDIDVAVGPNARLAVTTAAAEKIYRSLGPDTEVAVNLAVAPGGALAWLPQETIVFDRVRLSRSIEVELAPGAELLLAEAVIFGRSAMGETVATGHFLDRRRVRIGGKLVFAETIRLDGEIEQALAERAIAGQGVAVASVLMVPGGDETVAAVRAAIGDCAGEVGISAWNGVAVARLVARDGAALRRDLICVLAALGVAPLPRMWLN